jgi:hypothetical protein
VQLIAPDARNRLAVAWRWRDGHCRASRWIEWKIVHVNSVNEVINRAFPVHALIPFGSCYMLRIISRQFAIRSVACGNQSRLYVANSKSTVLI